MPLPQDDTLPEDNTASTSHTQAPPSELSAGEVLEKFKQLGVDAQAEDNEDDDEEDGDEEEGVAGPSGTGATEGAGGEGGKKKKKKKKAKGKASKAVAKLKWVLSSEVRVRLMVRDIATGGAPQELIDAVRDNMDASEQGATDGQPKPLYTGALADGIDDIKKALKAVDLMKMLDGQIALGNKSNSKNLGEHKVS